MQNIKIDISLRDDLIRQPELRYLLPIYPDITTFSIPVMSLEEIVAEKIAAMIERNKMRDVYDVYFLVAIKNVQYNEKMVIEKMLRRCEVFQKIDLIKKLGEVQNKMKWKSELAYIVNPLPDNLEVISMLEKILGLS